MQNQRLQTQVLKPQGDTFIRLNISRNTLIAFILSLIVHAMILFVVVPILPFNQATQPHTTLEISLAPVKVEPIIEPAPAEPLPEILPEKPVVKKVEKKEKPKRKILAKPATVKQKSDFTVPEEQTKAIVESTPQPEPPMNSTPASEPTDMASYIKAQQAKRNAGEVDAARQNAEAIAREQGPTEDEKRDARIKNNLKEGTNGIFEITSLSTRRATFSFKGWTNDYSNARRQFFEVEAASGEDVRLVMVKKMISLIRQHYQGNFNWESQRLQRTIVKSARLEDNAELEDFLMMEFFGSRYKTLAY